MSAHPGDRFVSNSGRSGQADAVSSVRLRPVVEQLELLQLEMRARHVEVAESFTRVHPVHRRDAQNLVDYLTLRQHDIRTLQTTLAEWGLSSLGRAEEHVLSTLERVIETVRLLAGDSGGPHTESAVDFGEGEHSLEGNATALLGPTPNRRSARILVTMPTEAATDAALVEQLLARGMDCARINCAHDSETEWLAMIANIRRASALSHRPCLVLMDLPGPKLRTGPVQPGPSVLKLRPRRDQRGRAVLPARAILVPQAREVEFSPPAKYPKVLAAPEWIERLKRGDEISLRDARGSARILTVVDDDGPIKEIEVWDTTYLESGMELVAPDRSVGVVGALPALEQSLRVRPGDVVTLSADTAPSDPNGTADSEGHRRLRIGCTLGEALGALRVDHRVFFDDGKIGGTVIALRPGEVDVAISSADPTGSNLRAEKGINLPDSELRIPAFGPEDESTLALIIEHADVVELSFAQRVADITSLQRRLAELGGEHLGIVLKIETVKGFNRLPDLLLAAMATERVGVMVARGDLAVECGFERLAEVQDEILWLCAAAHLPVIWATEVLDQMARTGRPSRSEVSDAALAGRAECVMLNKGPHICEAVSGLDDILQRMSEHQRKKVALLRRLRSWYPEQP